MRLLCCLADFTARNLHSCGYGWEIVNIKHTMQIVLSPPKTAGRGGIWWVDNNPILTINLGE